MVPALRVRARAQMAVQLPASADANVRCCVATCGSQQTLVVQGCRREKCSPILYDRAGLKDVFRCKTVAFIGDSIVRLLAQRMIRDMHVRRGWKHSDYHHVVPGSNTRIDFYWEPTVRSRHALAERLKSAPVQLVK